MIHLKGHIMRLLNMVVMLILTTVSANSMADDLAINPQGMFYISIPFDGPSFSEHKSNYGFRFDSHAYSRYDRISYIQQLDRPAVFDFKLAPEGIEGIYISGINYYQMYKVYKQNEDEEEFDYEDQVSVMDEIKGTISDMSNIAPIGVWIGAGLGIGLLLGSGSSNSEE